ncbi:MAG: hypothetical protein IJJ06_09800 [Mogibacterium sp.]|nr:hypothetical protein [Mogibacterium sp.]
MSNRKGENLIRLVTARLLVMFLAMAMVFTMMPVADYVFAADETSTAVFSVSGDDLVTSLSYDSIKTLKNDENIKPLIKEGVVFRTLNSSNTEGSATVTGVTVEDLLKLAGFKDGKELDTVTATAEDGYSKTYTADQILKEDLQGNKAMFVWDDGGEKVQEMAVGQFAADEQNKKLWVAGNTITLTVTAKDAGSSGTDPSSDGDKKPDTKPEGPVLSVVGDDLSAQLSYESIKILKNDENVKPFIKEDVVFHTLNSKETEEDFTVTGVTIEDLINLAGIKDGKELDSVLIEADDGYNTTYTADMIINADIQGNKAMFIWSENGEKVQKTAIGQFAEGEMNKGKWVKGETIKITVTAKDVPAPIVPSVKRPGKVTIKSVTSKKTSVTLKWKKVSGAKGYVVYRSTKKSSGFKAVKTFKKGSTVKFTNKKLKKNKTYYYKIRAYKLNSKGKKVFGKYSKVKKIRTKK